MKERGDHLRKAGGGAEDEGMERGEGQSTKEGEHALRQWLTQQSNPPTVVLCDTIDYEAALGSTNCARHAKKIEKYRVIFFFWGGQRSKKKKPKKSWSQKYNKNKKRII